ncbi:MAG: hypothetical protein ACOYNY_24365 [Caldilineaceae bacterium]|jgi:hypothetical protein
MKTGVSYLGHHNPKHMATDFRAMRELQRDDLFRCMQVTAFVHRQQPDALYVWAREGQIGTDESCTDPLLA